MEDKTEDDAVKYHHPYEPLKKITDTLRGLHYRTGP